jgi:transposase
MTEEILLYKDLIWVESQHALGKSYRTIAKEQGVTYDAFYNHIRRCRGEFRKKPEKGISINSELLCIDPEWVNYQHDVLGKTYAIIAEEQGVSYDMLRYYRNRQDPKYKENRKKYKKSYDEENKEKRSEYEKGYLKNLRDKLYLILPPMCAFCGEDNIKFLTFDHIKNNGAEERGKSKSNILILRKLKRQGWPEDYIKENYQILCWNCNCSKSFRNHFDLSYGEQTRSQRYQIKLWKECLEFFGPCRTCGDSNLKHLTISHIHNDGSKRAKNGEPRGGLYLMQHFRNLGWPESLKEDFALQCFNCNCSQLNQPNL